MDERRRKQNTGFALLFGMAAGAAIGWWLNSDNGRQFRKDASEKVNDYSSKVSDQAAKGYEAARESANQAIEKGKNYAAAVSETLKEKATNYAETATNVVDQTGDALKTGAEKARKRLHANEIKADQIIENGQA